ncbi:hypothetical protein [Planococcus lenghuensis]|uniref:Uncharacterized protein n=1 Tax=Planococcus lenghuensis TaxID=2213202 RepID=A0A1Q2KYF7_9BACL|nr:hypothetical protein [Planococcus lenghuensis]AQQ53219.1 hypothetical protein B0X71_09095 [Planococcus lenghuensis]
MKLFLFVCSILLLSACSPAEVPDLNQIIQLFEEEGIVLTKSEGTEGFEVDNSMKTVYVFDEGVVDIFSFSTSEKKEKGFAELMDQIEMADMPASPLWTVTEKTIVLVIPFKTNDSLLEKIEGALENIEQSE